MRSLFAFLLFFFSLCSVGQNAPVFRQFYFNPYLFNPAFAGSTGYTEVFLYHRQQWLNFNNAPIISGFNIQHSTPNRVAFGFNFTMQEVVALRNTSAMLTFAYRIPLSTNQYLSFGLSGGMGSNDLNLDNGDYSNDPAVVNALNNSFYADGNFGALYTLGQLRIGFALPRLFGQKYFSQQSLSDIRYSQLLNQLYTASYKFQFGSGVVSVEPYFLYRVNRDNQNFWEVSSLIYFKDKVWLGASYNETLGAGFFLGFDIKDKLRLSYSYELPPVSSEFIAASSHEFQLNIRLGKKKIFKWAEKPTPAPQVKPKVEEVTVEPIAEEALQVPQEQPTAVPRKATEKIIEPLSEVIPSRADEPTEINPQEDRKEEVAPESPSRQSILAPGYYIIVASFGNPQNALREKERFVAMGYSDAYASQNQQNKLYYVYIYSSLDFELARQARDSFRLLSASRNAWILRID